ncbi:MAG: hypothetical protein AAGA69_09910, partial [Pseudomonadota bacterium]
MFDNPVVRILPFAFIGAWYYAPTLSNASTMVAASRGPALEVSISGPRLSDPRQEAARQSAIYQAVNAQMTTCNAAHFTQSRNDLEDAAEVAAGYYERNEAAYARNLQVRYEDTGRVQQELVEDLGKTGDGLIGSFRKTWLVLTQRDEMVNDIQDQLGMPGVKL